MPPAFPWKIPGSAGRWPPSRPARGKRPALLPNLGGSLPNDAFSEILGLPTLWVPHSYPACLQHGPDEHLLGPMSREALMLMAGLFWDLGETGPGIRAKRAAKRET